MIGRALTEAEKNQIAEMYTIGFRRAVISSTLNVSLNTVDRVVRSRKIKRSLIRTRPEPPHRCSTCGGIILTNVCLKCQIEMIPCKLEAESKCKRKVKIPAVLGVNLTGDEYARYLDVRNRIGLPQMACME